MHRRQRSEAEAEATDNGESIKINLVDLKRETINKASRQTTCYLNDRLTLDNHRLKL